MGVQGKFKGSLLELFPTLNTTASHAPNAPAGPVSSPLWAEEPSLESPRASQLRLAAEAALVQVQGTGRFCQHAPHAEDPPGTQQQPPVLRLCRRQAKFPRLLPPLGMLRVNYY